MTLWRAVAKMWCRKLCAIFSGTLYVWNKTIDGSICVWTKVLTNHVVQPWYVGISIVLYSLRLFCTDTVSNFQRQLLQYFVAFLDFCFDLTLLCFMVEQLMIWLTAQIIINFLNKVCSASHSLYYLLDCSRRIISLSYNWFAFAWPQFSVAWILYWFA